MNTPPELIPQSQWPKPYLLQIMEAALTQGCIRLDIAVTAKALGKPAAQVAQSLIGSLNRIRRRSDKQHKSFIKPEYHLISTTWEPDRNTLLVTYSSLPDGHSLPPFVGISEEEKRALPLPQPAEQSDTPIVEVERQVGFDPAALLDDLLATEADRLARGG